ncbi:MAG TPA: hypothetical protein VGQ56_02605 [Gemmatimonadaceae bacterium]|nr:hypothetical protein [Gemmatimonadaceae bacterium]
MRSEHVGALVRAQTNRNRLLIGEEYDGDDERRDDGRKSPRGLGGTRVTLSVYVDDGSDGGSVLGDRCGTIVDPEGARGQSLLIRKT